MKSLGIKTEEREQLPVSNFEKEKMSKKEVRISDK
jgi:hypothetical protein